MAVTNPVSEPADMQKRTDEIQAKQNAMQLILMNAQMALSMQDKVFQMMIDMIKSTMKG